MSMDDLKKFMEGLIAKTNENIGSIHTTIKTDIEKTNEKIDLLQSTIKTDISKIQNDLLDHQNRIEKVESEITSNNCSDTIAELSLEIEHLKQDRLRNNIRITGLPEFAFNDPDESILRIDQILSTGLIPSDWTVHADRNKSSLIISFTSHAVKRFFMDEIRKKQTLFAEELYDNIRSNSRVYFNDQLTPYFAKLFNKAWTAKKAGTLFTVSSLGGRIRVKKFENGPSIVINTESQLQCIVDSEQMETSNTHTEPQHSQMAPENNRETPKSVDSEEARKIRAKEFTHNRQSTHIHQQNRQQTPSRFSRPPVRHNNQYTQRDFDRSQAYGQKRNNRFVTSLDHKSQQPNDKRRLTTTNPAAEYSYQYKRDYQNKLRSFTK